MLETLVHVDSPTVLMKKFAFRTAEFDEGLCETIEIPDLPDGWDGDTPISATQNIGDRWVREKRSAVLAVPSVLSPEEWNYLLNPEHSDFQKLHFGPVQPYVFSSRFKK
ncbi:MAG: RES family NAD+ phosphorylase [Kiritimatiellia bacterium]